MQLVLVKAVHSGAFAGLTPQHQQQSAAPWSTPLRAPSFSQGSDRASSTVHAGKLAAHSMLLFQGSTHAQPRGPLLAQPLPVSCCEWREQHTLRTYYAMAQWSRRVPLPCDILEQAALPMSTLHPARSGVRFGLPTLVCPTPETLTGYLPHTPMKPGYKCSTPGRATQHATIHSLPPTALPHCAIATRLYASGLPLFESIPAFPLIHREHRTATPPSRRAPALRRTTLPPSHPSLLLCFSYPANTPLQHKTEHFVSPKLLGWSALSFDLWDTKHEQYPCEHCRASSVLPCCWNEDDHVNHSSKLKFQF